MFQMMNEARISVGLGAAASAYRGYRLALGYAKTRKQGRVPGGGGAGPVALIDHADIRRMLLAQKAYAEGALSLCLYCARLVDDMHTEPAPALRDNAGALLGLLTPVAKTWPSEWGLASLDLAIQVHGGYGYTRDFDVEQLYRDSRLNPIHEGTTGIQAIDLASRKLRKDRGAAFNALRERIERTEAAAASRSGLRAMAGQLAAARRAIEGAVRRLVSESDERLALLHATPFIHAFGHLVVGWMWLDQMVVMTSQRAGDFAAGRAQACAYYFDFELPKIGGWLAPIMNGSTVTAGAWIGDS